MSEIFEATQTASPATEGVGRTGGEFVIAPHSIRLEPETEHFISRVVRRTKNVLGISSTKPHIEKPVNLELNEKLREIRDNLLNMPEYAPPAGSEISTLAD